MKMKHRENQYVSTAVSISQATEFIYSQLIDKNCLKGFNCLKNNAQKKKITLKLVKSVVAVASQPTPGQVINPLLLVELSSESFNVIIDPLIH